MVLTLLSRPVGKGFLKVKKIDAILSLMEFSGRLKDYYDIYYLSNKFDFDNDDAMQKKWKAFVRKIDTKTDVYRTVLKSIKAITSIISRHRP